MCYINYILYNLFYQNKYVYLIEEINIEQLIFFLFFNDLLIDYLIGINLII